MPVDMILPLSIICSVVTWSTVLVWYIHPVLAKTSLAAALKPLLLIHCFRYVGLMFLVPGVTSEILDNRFSYYAAYGDFIAVLLALIALIALHNKSRNALFIVLIFNVWGFFDLVNAVVRGILFTVDGHLGATYWIPAVYVPLLLVTHVYIFILLIKRTKWNRFNFVSDN